MDYRRPLFQLEQWSPFLARKVWGLTSFLDAPFAVALGLRINTLSDLNVELELASTPLNRTESGALRSSTLVAAGEYASKILWQRHLDPHADGMDLTALHCKFLKPAVGRARVRAELVESERERMLHRLRSGAASEYEMPVLFFDDKDQQVASMNCVWSMKPMRPFALAQGRNS